MLGLIGQPVIVRPRRSIFETVFGAIAAVIVWFVLISLVVGLLSGSA